MKCCILLTFNPPCLSPICLRFCEELWIERANLRVCTSLIQRLRRDAAGEEKKIELKKGIDVEVILKSVYEKYISQRCNTEYGLKIEFGNEWVHMCKSNTEPIIRIYAESKNEQSATELAKKMIMEIEEKG